MIWIILIVFLADVLYSFLLGYREVQILCQQVIDEIGQQYTSWKWKDYKKHWYWFTDQIDKSKSNWDSFHVSNGVAVAIYCIVSTIPLVIALSLAWYWIFIAAIRWIYIFQLRNLKMHTIIKL